jgi:hypothetical protein
MSENLRVEPARAPISSFRLGALLAIGAAAFFVAWLVLRDGGNSTTSGTPAPGAVQAASRDDLRSLAGSLDHPLYWAGVKKNFTYELTRTTDGRVYIRYLPAGVKVGDKRAKFLTIGTYPRKKAFAELERAAKSQGSVKVGFGHGGLMVFSQAKPTSVYFGFPNARFQVEVYDPSADTARRLVLAGQVVPID